MRMHVPFYAAAADMAQLVKDLASRAGLQEGQVAGVGIGSPGLIDAEHDSLRFYYLGNHWEKRVEHIGAKAGYNPEGLLMI